MTKQKNVTPTPCEYSKSSPKNLEWEKSTGPGSKYIQAFFQQSEKYIFFNIMC